MSRRALPMSESHSATSSDGFVVSAAATLAIRALIVHLRRPMMDFMTHLRGFDRAVPPLAPKLQEPPRSGMGGRMDFHHDLIGVPRHAPSRLIGRHRLAR